jgi:hypothetical protein
MKIDMRILNPERHNKSTPHLLKRLYAGSTFPVLAASMIIISSNLIRTEDKVNSIIGMGISILMLVGIFHMMIVNRKIISELQTRLNQKQLEQYRDS